MPAGGRPLLATAAVCATAAASLVAPSGCAQTDELSDRLSKAQYLIELRAVVAEVRASIRRLTRFEEFPSLVELDRLLNQAIAEYRRIVDRMEAIEPPEDVEDLHERFTAVLVTAEGALLQARRAVNSGDVRALVGLGEEVTGLTRDVAQLRADYAERGYDLERKGKETP